MVSEGVRGVGGQTWAPLAYAINAMVQKEPMPYFPVCVMAKEAFLKGKLADSTFATAYSPWTVGYMAGSAATKTLGKKRVFFLARADSWGWISGRRYPPPPRTSAEIAADEVSLGTSDFTTVLQKVRAAKPDVFIAAQFAGDAVALLKQVHQMGLNKEMTIFNAFITNVVAKGIPPQALEGVYAMHYFYYDLSEFEDKEVAKSAKEFTELYQAKYKTLRMPMPPSHTPPTWKCSGGLRRPSPSSPKPYPQPSWPIKGNSPPSRGLPCGARITRRCTSMPPSW
jgi:ABC-type branched-subunit amino acid transport system substrate-binding protein